MKDNLYTQSIKNIRAPKHIVERTLILMDGAKTESEVTMIKKKSRTTFRLVSTVAAVLALIITLGAIAFTDSGVPSERSFVLTVGAAETTLGASADEATADEITPDAYVKVSEIKSFTSGAHYLADNLVLREDGYYVPADSTRKLLSLSQEFTLDMTCTGDDIESITYTAHNSCFAYYDSYEGFISAVNLTSEEVERYNASGGIDYNKWASSCTFDYNCQPKSSWDKEAVVFEGDDVVDGTIPLRIHFNFDFEEGEYTFEVDDEEDSDAFKSIFEKEFNAHADEFSMDVTANYKDGTTCTKTLKFKCELEGNFLYLYAIEV